MVDSVWVHDPSWELIPNGQEWVRCPVTRVTNKFVWLDGVRLNRADLESRGRTLWTGRDRVARARFAEVYAGNAEQQRASLAP